VKSSSADMATMHAMQHSYNCYTYIPFPIERSCNHYMCKNAAWHAVRQEHIMIPSSLHCNEDDDFMSSWSRTLAKKHGSSSCLGATNPHSV